MLKLFSVLISCIFLSNFVRPRLVLATQSTFDSLDHISEESKDRGNREVDQLKTENAKLLPNPQSPVPNPQSPVTTINANELANSRFTSADNLLAQTTSPPPPPSNLSPPNLEPRPNTDRFIQPAPLIPPNPQQQQAPVLQTPTPTPTTPAPPAKIQVRKIEVTGNTIFSTEINGIIKPWEGKVVTLEELGKVADEITQLYVQRGYITSRAVLVDQTITDGVVRILVIEGSLEKIEIERNQRLRSSYIRSRVQLGASKPLNSAKLEDQLRLLRFNPIFENVEASLRPGTGQGQSILVVRVTEAKPFKGSTFSADNYSPPSIGSERLGANLVFRNLSGIGDTVFGSYYRSTTGGSNVLDLSYTVPINAMDGTLQVRAAPNYYNVTEQEFKNLNIRGESQLYEFSYRQPLIRSTRQEFALSVAFTYRQSQSFRDDKPYAFGNGPDDKGRTRTSVIGFGQDYVLRDVKGATALRSLFSFGIGELDATINSHPIPDGRFFAWLGQVQRVQKISNNNILIVQGDLQLTPDSLLPSQQFVIGGGQSIRGYRQNLRAGDNGFRFSVEDRIIIAKDKSGKEIFQLAPFFDMGTVWNNPGNPNLLPSRRFLAGAGLGVLWEPLPRLNLRIDYGIPIIYTRDRGNNIQDHGFYFQVLYQL